jgi:hypothetical protein
MTGGSRPSTYFQNLETKTMSTKTNYQAEAMSDAKDTATNFLDEIVDAICDNGEASDDLLNDYANGDGYHHENHVDQFYDLTEAAELLDELSRHEETDTGLWAGLSPRDAICAQAAYTYGNAVMSDWQDIIKQINSDAEIEELRDAYKKANDYSAGDADEWNVDECCDFLASIGVDPETIDVALEDEDEWRKRVDAEAATAPDEIKTEITKTAEQIINDA